MVAGYSSETGASRCLQVREHFEANSHAIRQSLCTKGTRTVVTCDSSGVKVLLKHAVSFTIARIALVPPCVVENYPIFSRVSHISACGTAQWKSRKATPKYFSEIDNCFREILSQVNRLVASCTFLCQHLASRRTCAMSSHNKYAPGTAITCWPLCAQSTN